MRAPVTCSFRRSPSRCSSSLTHPPVREGDLLSGRSPSCWWIECCSPHRIGSAWLHRILPGRIDGAYAAHPAGRILLRCTGNGGAGAVMSGRVAAHCPGPAGGRHGIGRSDVHRIDGGSSGTLVPPRTGAGRSGEQGEGCEPSSSVRSHWVLPLVTDPLASVSPAGTDRGPPATLSLRQGRVYLAMQSLNRDHAHVQPGPGFALVTTDRQASPVRGPKLGLDA
jgi:hypothetical protein